MNLIVFALRRPITIIVAMIAIVLGASLAVRRMQVDIFPALNLPVIYVCQPYGGMDPAQMEGFITNYYEYHFLYINGIHHVESRNVQGMSLMKLQFHPGTNMAQAMAETISYVNRSRAMMPPGTVPPFVMRFDTGSVPVGYLVLSSDTAPVSVIQDRGLFHVRPMFASLPGVSAPPPFGGSARAIVVNCAPDKLRAQRISPDQIIMAISASNILSPSGNIHLDDKYPIVPLNSIVRDPQELKHVPLTQGGEQPPIYLRDVIESIEDSTDLTTGYALVNGRRAVYMLVTKRADASTLSVVNEVKRALPKMRDAVKSEGIEVNFEFDQSPYVTGAIRSLITEGALGAVLTGLMVLVFLRDWRSAVVVVLNIPLALAAALCGLWLTGETINLMTLGGLALAIGILVDEATVEIENIHTQMGQTPTIAHAVRAGNAQTAVPRLLSMLCILAVFLPAFFMEASARGLFLPLSLAVAFAMIASYFLSSTFVPVMSTWLLRHVPHSAVADHETGMFARLRRGFQSLVDRLIGARWLLAPVYLLACGGVLWLLAPQLGIDIFPKVDAGQFRLRLRAPDGTHFDTTEQLAREALAIVGQVVGPERIDRTLGYIGSIPPSFPVNAVYQWSRGPEEAILRVALKPGEREPIETLKERLRAELNRQLPQVRASFEPGDIVNEVMSFGSATPLEIAAVGGKNAADVKSFMLQLKAKLAELPAVRDLHFAQSLEYPTVEVQVDREKAGLAGVAPADVARSLVAATSSSRFVVPNYWPDAKTGIGYQVQVQIPQRLVTDANDLGILPVKQTGGVPLLLRDVAQLTQGTMPGQFDRYNMKRELTLTANIYGSDLYRVANDVQRTIASLGKLPDGVDLQIRGQIPPLRELLSGLTLGLGLALVVILLLLAANFQSWRLALVALSTAPAAMTGVVVMLFLTHTTLNLQSFIGSIMALGVAMA
ncbi:MAG: efflux RND transporter permease subunit, partial [Planctomycetaceae bacterium]|nr:efflux RND transporter permease subunit [Planctomycetaceae bacterium]